MPIYEYRCGDCGNLSSFFTRSINAAVEPVCSHCQSVDMVRCMSSFAMGKTLQAVHEANPMGSGPQSSEYYKDPRNIGRHVEERFAKHGVEMPQTVRESIDAARGGNLPKSVDL